MAQRLVLQRLLSLTPRTLPLQSPLAPRVPPAPRSRAFSTSAACRSTFNVQDGNDFQDRVVNNPKPVVVDFHAQWCGPCKILGPRLEKMVAKQDGKVLMAKVDIDDHTDLAIEYEVGVGRVQTFFCWWGKEGPFLGKGVPAQQWHCWRGEALQVSDPTGRSLVGAFHCLALLQLCCLCSASPTLILQKGVL
uniref:Thioredoxin 2 n=1 Tax=Otus sunia TaxID=257818 RepID=A0A8C8AQS1_9STRI